METITVADATITVGLWGHDRDGRMRFAYRLQTPTIDHSGTDLRSGCGVGMTESDGMESLLSFLQAAGEAYGYALRTGRESDNGDLFPPDVMEWCYLHSDALGAEECGYQWLRLTQERGIPR